MVTYVLLIVLVAFLFDFINGFHDSANSIATVVGTRVLSPLAAVVPAGWTKTLVFIVLSPLIGMAAGFALMVAVFWLFRRVPPGRVDRLFRVGQLASSALFSLSHGANDAQKTMGIIVGLLAATSDLFRDAPGVLRHFHVPDPTHVPYWVEIGAYTAIALGTLFGGWRIVHTMGQRITRLRPVNGFCAETGGAFAILLATGFGIPVSTTHTITGAIVGVGATQRLSAVRWGIAGRIVWAWVLTIPASALLAAAAYGVLALVVGA